GCLIGTRVNILEDLRAWSHDQEAPSIFWLAGMAGTGKSAISRSFCRTLGHDGLLGGSFFCSRSGSVEEADTKRILPTLSASLASRDTDYKNSLLKVLKSTSVSSESNILLQLEHLFEKPLRSRSTDAQKLVFVVDALDECSGENPMRELLTGLTSFHPPLPIKFFLTSRPERHIRDQFDVFDASLLGVLRLHDIEKTIVQADIHRYLTNRLEQIHAEWSRRVRSFPLHWPSPTDVTILTEHAGKLFIYAFTAVEYVRRERPVQRLQTLTDIPIRAGQPFHKALDDLYSRVLEEAMDPVQLEIDEINSTRRILAAIMAAREPLTVSSLSALLDIPAEELRSTVDRLHAVIYVPQTDDFGALAPFHASFGDFLSDSTRVSGNMRLDLPGAHHTFARQCAIVMHDRLCFNISRCPSSYYPNSSQQLAKVPEPIRYACLHWPHHLASVESSDLTPALDALTESFPGRFLFWLEALSAAGEIGQAIALIRKALETLRQSVILSTLVSFLYDALEFIQSSREAIHFNAAHIYMSALPFSSPISAVVQRSLSAFSNLPHIGLQGIFRVPSLMPPINDRLGSVRSVAFSPDGTRIVSGSGDKTIRVWDTRTGQLDMPPIEGHIDYVHSVAFSPDGTRIVSGSDDKTVRVWNAQTGQLEMPPIKGHTYSVRSVAFSPDGTRIVSGSEDKTVRVWNARTGQLELSLIKGHTSWVNSVAFSPDGTRIVSGSDDQTTRVWNAQTSQLGMSPIQGHTDSVYSVAFSPDGTRIVSGSGDKTIRVWNAQTGQLEMPPIKGRAGLVSSVAFSPDGTRIVSSSANGRIHVWNAQTGQFETPPIEGHTSWVSSVAFSPDGTRIVSGSRDETIRVWNAQTGQLAMPPIKGHTWVIRSVAFSPDGTRIVSGSDDKTVRVWNAHTGRLGMSPIQGHTDSVYSVAFSSDGTRIVSGSGDKTIRVWNAQTGQLEIPPIKGHTYSVHSVAFSPDGTRIVSGSRDKTIRVWNAQTGQL
ncbi:WD40-repeat-containing domain protein, partial [Vararia minispora EC-137]